VAAGDELVEGLGVEGAIGSDHVLGLLREVDGQEPLARSATGVELAGVEGVDGEGDEVVDQLMPHFDMR
jgi:hypothetical protein